MKLLLAGVSTLVFCQWLGGVGAQYQPRYQPSTVNPYNRNNPYGTGNRNTGYNNNRNNNQRYGQGGYNNRNRLQPTTTTVPYAPYGNNNNNNGRTWQRIVPNDISTKKDADPRVTLSLQLLSYSNQNQRLPNNSFCYWNNPEKAQHNCRFMFITVVSCPGEISKYIATEFIYPQGGGIDLTSAAGSNWAQPKTFTLPQKPVAIDLFVYHLGNVVKDNLLKDYDQLILVDSFNIDLLSLTPGLSESNVPNNELKNDELQTSMRVSYSIDCVGNYKGRFCDLVDCQQCQDCDSELGPLATCRVANDSQINGDNRQNNYNTQLDSGGAYKVCKWVYNQATDCVTCPYGATRGNCNPSPGFYRDTMTAGVVSSTWRTWGIILIVLCVLLLVCLLVTLILLCAAGQRKSGRRGSESPRSAQREYQPYNDDRVTDQPQAHLVGPPQMAPPYNVNGYTKVPSETPTQEWPKSNVVAVVGNRPADDSRGSTSHNSGVTPPRATIDDGASDTSSFRNQTGIHRREAQV